MDLEKKFSTAKLGDEAEGRAARRGRAATALSITSNQTDFARFGGVALLAIFVAIASSQVRAQQQRPDAGSVLEGLKPAPTFPRSPADVLPRPAEPRPALGAPGLKVTVKRFTVSGNTIYSEAELLATVKEFLGKELNIDGLNDAATKIRAHYREHGYFLSQAYLPQQEVRDGVVEIAVIEARFGKVSVDIKEGTRLSESLIRGIVEHHLLEGNLITEAGLERPLLLLNDLPNTTVISEIKPSQTIGSADLTVRVAESPGFVNGQIGIDNYGNRFTGAWRATFDFNITNPLALGDQLSFTNIRTDDHMGVYRYSYALPVGPWGTRVGLAWTQFSYVLGKDFASFKAHGTGTIASLLMFHPIIRTRGENVILQVSYDEKNLSDRSDAVASISDRTVDATHVGVVGDFRDGVFGGGLNSFGFTLTEGNTFIHQQGVLLADQSATGRLSAGRFAKTNYEFRRLQKITDNTNLLLSLTGQRASKNLTSVEKFSLGGVNGVRSYPAGEALGDSGWIFQGELRYIVPGWKVWDGDVTVMGFWDQGYVLLNKDAQTSDITNKRNLSGYGLGGSIGKDTNFILRAYAAWRNEREGPQADAAPRVPRVWVQAIKWF